MAKKLEFTSSPLIKALAEMSKEETPAKPANKVRVEFLDPNSSPEYVKQMEDGKPIGLSKSIENILNGKNEITRLAFQSDPAEKTGLMSLYYAKIRLLPFEVLKRIAVQDDLVAAIVNARANHMASFGRPQPDRFSTGFKIEPMPGIVEQLEAEDKKKLQDDIEKATKRLATCGTVEDWDADERWITFSQFLKMSTRNALIVGRVATEMIWAADVKGGDKKFLGFRPIDAGTIYKAVPKSSQAETVRDDAARLLMELKKQKLPKESDPPEDFQWVQVIHGQPRQVFTDDECALHNFYPVTDVELYGAYPVTPLDTVWNHVLMHLNITEHNKLYFQNGRAAKGMLVIKSDDVDDGVIQGIRQTFQASINGVHNAFRAPVFGVGSKDDLAWEPLDGAGGSRDMEFQYLLDMNSRVILSAFQMSPEELPGYGHLSKGTNSQALCLSPRSNIFIPEGYKSISEVLGVKDSANTKVWTGTAWADARVFRTGLKELTRTKFRNGLALETSPDHQYRVVGEDGEPTWKRQEDIRVGEYVLVNKAPVVGSNEYVPSYKGKKLDAEMAELLGWMTGDGNFNVLRNKNTKNIKSVSISLLYHHECELDIKAKYEALLEKWSLRPKDTSHDVTEKEREFYSTVYNYKTLADKRLKTTIYNNDFGKWLLSLGFTPSSRRAGEGKSVPPLVHTLPIELRKAFLRGLFSADGHRGGSLGGGKSSDVVKITCHDHRLRGQIKSLLMSVGLRTQMFEGNVKYMPAKNGQPRERIEESTVLTVKDKHLFNDLIGFIQDYKQPVEGRRGNIAHTKRYERAPISVIEKYTKLLLQKDGIVRKLTKNERNNAYSVLSPTIKRGCSLHNLRLLMAKVDLQEPSWMSEYHLEEVASVERFGYLEEMVDVEVYNNEHAFVANGVVVHNSESNSEYQLTAARDVGLRPLISEFQDYVNARIFPLLDPKLSKICVIKFLGLDAETSEKESIRTQQDMAIHMTYDEVLAKVEKEPIGRKFGGEFPLNAAFAVILEKYRTKGWILEHLFDVKGAEQDPSLQYCLGDQVSSQLFIATAQAQMQAQAQPQPQPGQDPNGGGQPQPSETGNALQSAIDGLSKSEEQMTHAQRKLKKMQERLIEQHMAAWRKDQDKALDEIVDIAGKFGPKGE